MTLNPTVLVINCGSSSIKFSVLTAGDCEAIISGIADGIGTETAFLMVDKTTRIQLDKGSYADALTAISTELEKRGLNQSISLIGHRIAHGGQIFSESVLIDDRVVEEIKKFRHWLRYIIMPICMALRLPASYSLELDRLRYLIPVSTKL